MIGKFIYLWHSRANIVYAISVVSQFMHVPLKPHLEVVYRIVIYLKGTPKKDLLFKEDSKLKFEVYVDVG